MGDQVKEIEQLRAENALLARRNASWKVLTDVIGKLMVETTFRPFVKNLLDIFFVFFGGNPGLYYREEPDDWRHYNPENGELADFNSLPATKTRWLDVLQDYPVFTWTQETNLGLDAEVLKDILVNTNATSSLLGFSRRFGSFQVTFFIANLSIPKDMPRYIVEIQDIINPLVLALRYAKIHEETKARANELEHAFHHAFQENPSIMSIISLKDLRRIEVNEAFERKTGYIRDEVIGHTEREVSVLPSPETFEDTIQKLKRGERLHDLEIKLKTKTGELFDARLSAALIDFAGEKSVIAVAEDITERKRAEQDLLHLNRDLEQRIKERTRALKEAQEKVVRQEKLAAIGKMAGSVAHELRNPLGIMNNSVYFLNMKLKDLDAKTRKHLEILSDQIRRSTAIVTEMLGFAKMPSPSVKTMKIRSVINHIISSIDVPTNIAVEYHEEMEGIALELDPDQISTAFRNIMVNAIQSMERRGKLSIDVNPLDKGVEIRFKDTGTGILPENLHLLFEPLFSTKTHGIGLGLCIAKDVVENHGGKIIVESVVNEGTTVITTFPLEGSHLEGM